MAIHTLDQLEAALTTDLKWRIQEMFAFERMVESARPHEQSPLLRGALALVYAHWEGYVKTAGSSYLEYISRKRLKLGQMRPEVAAIALRAKIVQMADEKSSQRHTELVQLLWDHMDDEVPLPYARATIRTRANLNFKLFESIMHSLGCSAAHHALQEPLIDERLLGARNEIAHGQREHVDLDLWIDTRDAVETILKDIRTQISNAAATESYRRAS